MKERAFLAVLVVLFLLLPALGSGHDRAVNSVAADGKRINTETRDNGVDRGPQLTTNRGENTMLQFRSGGHILGFQTKKAYLASLDHALSVEFLGTKGVAPSQIKTRIGETADARALGAVHYKNLWEGISLTYEATEKGIAESTYHVAPKADVSSIRFRYNVPVDLQKDGSLRFSFERGFLTESAPVAWQEIADKQVPVEVAFKVSEGEVGFRVGKYDPRYPLTIDPTYAWHTFYGSNSDEAAYGIAVDGDGNIYVTGVGSITWNGPAGQAPLHAYSGGGDFFVLKLDSSGVYQWHTFYGSNLGSAYAYGIVVDGNGNTYVTGNCNHTWNGPGTPGPAPLHAFTSSDYGMFVLKLDTNGAYQWHTFYGSGGANAIALDGGGGVYVTGTAGVTWNGPSGQVPLHAFTTSLPGWNYGDLVVLKLDTNGAYQWHTFYGASGGSETGRAIAVGGEGLYVTGYCATSWTGPSAAAPLHAYSGGGVGNIFVLKLNGNGAYQWHTFYGTVNGATAYAITADAYGNVYVVGTGSETWNGPAGQAPLHGYVGSYVANILALKLDSAGAYQWHTFYGSSIGNKGSSVALDSNGGVYVGGNSSGTWTGPAGQAPLHTFGSGYGIAILKLDSAGSYQWHDFYGSPSSSYANGIAVSGPDMVYVTGYSTNSWNGPAGQAPLHARTGGSWEIFVLKTATTVKNDFNSDGKPDILWRNTATGENAYWYMNGTTIIGSASILTLPDQNWTIVGTGDFNSDGKPDILWRNTATGENAYWYMNGTTIARVSITSYSPGSELDNRRYGRLQLRRASPIFSGGTPLPVKTRTGI